MRQSSTNEITVSKRIIKIAIAAIAIGIMMILIAVATSLGLQREIKRKVVALSGDMRIAPFENNNSSLSIRPIDSRQINQKTWFSTKKIELIHPFINKAVLLKNNEEFEGGILKGINSDFSFEKISDYWISGSALTFSDIPSKEIILSQTMTNKLNVKLGDRITAYFQSKNTDGIPKIRYFTLLGIFETGFPEFDQSFAFVDIRQLQNLNQWSSSQIGGYEVFFNSQVDMDKAVEDIYQQLPPEIDAQSVRQLFPSIYEWIALFDFNVLIILIVMVLVGTLNMSTALLVLILERSRMIGVLKSLGASNKQIQRVFLWNASYIVAKGLLIGNIVALFILGSQYYWGWLTLDPETYYVNEVPIYFSFSYFSLLNLFVLGICILLLWIPSSLVSRIDPIRVLRFR